VTHDGDIVTSPSPEPLLLGVSAMMESASAALCDIKLSMDRFARGFIGQPFLDDWMGGRDTCAYWGDELLRLVVPFLAWERRDEVEPFKAYVNPRNVLGASIKGLPEHVPEREVQDRIARYANVFGSRSNAYYIWYKPLGILTAHEGKHRVAFMRAHGQPAIAAWVKEASYPAADRITVVEPDEDRGEWLAILDERYVQVLKRPRVSLVMLRAYGVTVTRWRDLRNVPSKSDVLREIYRLRVHLPPQSLAEEDRTLDLARILERESANAQVVNRDILHLEPHRWDWRRHAIVVAACGALALMLRLLPWHTAHVGAWLSGGCLYGLVCAPLLLRFVGPRRVGTDASNV
jgi:hypothetical protein